METAAHPGITTLRYKVALGFLIAFFLLSNLIYAQDVVITQPLGQTVATCNQNQFIATMLTDTFSLQLDVSAIKDQDTIDAVPCIRYGFGSNNPLAIIIDSIDNGTFSYDTINLIWNINATLTNPITIYYRILIDCSLTSQAANINIVLHQKWLDVTGTPVQLTINQPSNTTYITQVGTPFIQMPQNLVQGNIEYLAPGSLIFPFKNSGTADAHIQFMFEDTSNCNSYNIDSLFYRVSNSPWIDITDSIGFFINNIIIPKNDSLEIRLVISGTACIGECDTLGIKFEWRCNYNVGSFCDECQFYYNVPFHLVKGNRSYKVERLQPQYFQAKYDHSCPDSSVTWRFRIFNNSTQNSAIDSMYFQLHNNQYGLTALTLIDPATVNITASSNINYNLTIDSAGLSACESQIPYPVTSVNIFALDWPVGDTIFLEFKTYKCCDEDSSLLNKVKSFNHWVIKSRGYDECNQEIFITNSGDTTYAALLNTPLGISSHSDDGSSDLNLKLDFEPQISDLSVDPDTNFGYWGDFSIKLQGLFTELVDAQLLGYGPPPNDSINGMLRATIKCEKGLRVEKLDEHVSLISGLDTLPVQFAYTLVPDTVCEQGEFVFYFEIKDVYSSVIKYFNQGLFNFKLQACCVAEEPFSNYSVEFHLLLNSNDCYSFTNGANQNTPPTCVDCCWLPLSSRGDKIFCHCAGCKKPGAIVESYKLRRTNYGFMDVDDNNIADGSSAIPIDSSNYINYFNLMNLNASTHGDKLRDHLVAKFQDGDPSIGGYDYNQMKNDSAFFHVLQLDRKILHSEASLMDLNVTDFTFYIDVEDAVNPDCINCEGFDGIDPNTHRTILQLTVPSAGLGIYMQRDSNQYFYTFIDSVVKANADTATTFNGYEPDQKYRLSVNYNVCGNFTETNPNFAVLGQIKKQSQIENNMWLSGKIHPSNAWNSPSSPTAPDTLTVNDTLNQAFADDHIFWCETFAGLHYFYGTTHMNATNYSSGLQCVKKISISAWVIVGNSFLNAFPYEVKIPSLAPKQIILDIPEGFQIDSAKIQSTGFATSNPLSFSNYTIIDTTVFIYWDSLPPIQCYNDSTTLSGLFVTDQYNVQQITFYLTPTVCDNDDLLNDSTYSVEDVIIVFENESYSCMTNVDSICSAFLDTIANQIGTPYYDAFSVPEPNLIVNVIQSYQITTTNQVCWSYEVSNDNIPGANPPTNYSSYTYIALPDSATVPYLSNWQVTLNNNVLPSVNNIFHLLNPNTNSPVNQIDVGTYYLGTICATHISCDTLDTTAFNIYYGWNCNGYPVSLDDTTICGLDTIPAGFVNDSVIVLVNSLSSPPVTLCDTIDFTVEYIVAQGAVYPQYISLDTIPAGYSVFEVLLSNCNDSSTVVLQQDTTLNYPITEAVLDSINIEGGILYNTSNCVSVTVKALLGCEFNLDMQAVPVISMNYLNYCGDEFTGTATPGAPDTSGSNCTTCFTLNKTVDPPDSAVVGQPVTYTIEVCNNNGQAQDVTLIDNLPQNFDTLSSTLPAPTQFSMTPGCHTYTVTGVFDTIGDCHLTNNVAWLYFNSNQDTLRDEACLDIFPDCDVFADSIIPDSTYLATYYPFITGVSNLTFNLKGRLYVNKDFTFTNCIIYAEPGSQIIVIESKTLTLRTTEILACSQMWRGILLKTSLTKIFVKDNSIIRDAEVGIYPEDRTTFDVRNSLFEDCVIGINIPAHPLDMGWNISGYVAGTTFDHSGQMRPMYSGQGLAYGTRPRAGISMTHMVMEVGDSLANENRFLNLNTGIYAGRSNVRVKNCNFENITKDSYYQQAYDGAAIASISRMTLTVAPALTSTNTMKDCNFGIYTYNTQADIKNIRMTNVGKGIYSEAGNLTYTKVTECNINATQFGIDWRLNSGATSMLAQDNVIHVNGTNGVGINLAEQNTTGNPNYNVKCNVIEVTGGYTGITSNNVLNGIITQNNVIMAGNVGHAGIELGSNKNTEVSFNSIVSNDDADTNKIGVATHISDRSVITCNTIDETGWGFFFGGSNLKTQFRGNEMYDHYDGLRLNNVAVIDTQSHAGNKWLGTYGNYGAVNMNDNPNSNIFLSLFIVNPTVSSLLPSTPTTNPNNTGWFAVVASGTAYSCSSPTSCNYVESGGGGRGSEALRMSIANDDTISSEYIDETKAIAKLSLYEELKEDSTTYENNTILGQFKIDNEQTSIGELYDVKAKFKESEIFDYNSTIILDSLINLITDQIYILDSISNADTTANLIETRQNLIDELNSIITQKDSILSLNAFEKEQIISEALSTNTTISTSGLPQTNEKEINRIAGEYLLYGKNYLINEYVILNAIASQCPYEGGKAVYRARVLLNLLVNNLVFNDSYSCLQQGIYRTSINKLSTEIFVIPNPANDLIEIKLSEEFTGICEINIVDVVGKQLLTERFSCETRNHFIDVKTLNPGIYLVRVNIDSKYYKTTKIVIMR